MIAVLFVGLTLMSASVTAQVKDWKIIGQIQIQAVYDTTGGSELFIKRSRVWTNGYFLPKLSFRFQYDFNTNKLMDTWVSLWHIPNLEIRIGRTWLPFIGDFTESPFLLDMIDFSVGATLFPAREQGVFFLGHYKSLSYNLSVVNGSGFAKDENKWKDIFGYLKLSFLNGKLTLGVAYYEGRDGEDGLLTTKQRYAGDIIANLNRLVTIKGAFIRGEDDEITSEGGWIRTLIHIKKSVDIIGEYDHLTEADRKIEYFTGGINFYFPIKHTKVGINWRHFFQPVTDNDFKIQLQVFVANNEK